MPTLIMGYDTPLPFYVGGLVLKCHTFEPIETVAVALSQAICFHFTQLVVPCN